MAGRRAGNPSVRCAVSRSEQTICERSRRESPTAIPIATPITAKAPCSLSTIMRQRPTPPSPHLGTKRSALVFKSALRQPSAHRSTIPIRAKCTSSSARAERRHSFQWCPLAFQESYGGPVVYVTIHLWSAPWRVKIVATRVFRLGEIPREIAIRLRKSGLVWYLYIR